MDTTAERTMAPTMKPVVWVDNDTGEGEDSPETTTESSSSSSSSGGGGGEPTTTNLWCGDTRFDATRILSKRQSRTIVLCSYFYLNLCHNPPLQQAGKS